MSYRKQNDHRQFQKRFQLKGRLSRHKGENTISYAVYSKQHYKSRGREFVRLQSFPVPGLLKCKCIVCVVAGARRPLKKREKK